MSRSDKGCPGGCKGYGGWWTNDSDPAYILCKVCSPSYSDLLNAHRAREAGDHSKSAWDFRAEREARGGAHVG